MKLLVEDEYSDIVGKAQKGLDVSTEELARQTKLEPEAVRAARRGSFDPNVASALAEALGLNQKGLLAIGSDRWRPAEPADTEGFLPVHSPFSDPYLVNAYLVWDPQTKEAVAFDAGTQAAPLIEAIERRGLKLAGLYLTHAHSDHIKGMPELLERFPCPVFANAPGGSIPSAARQIGEGHTGACGSLRIEVLETPGHTADGLTFVVKGLDQTVAVVGDALFAGSIGGPSYSYPASLESLAKLLALDSETVLAPGHGPLTTVAEERQMNAFWTGD